MKKLLEKKKPDTAIAVFVKTPGLSQIKTKLSKQIGPESALKLYELFINIIEQKLEKTKRLSNNQVETYWAIAEKEGLTNKRWQNFEKIYAKGEDLGQKLENTYNKLKEEYKTVILIGADSPQISEQLILSSASLLKNPNKTIIGPTCDGGFYLFASQKNFKKDTFTNIKYDQPDTLKNLSEKIEKQSQIEYLEMMTDIDVANDIITLLNELL